MTPARPPLVCLRDPAHPITLPPVLILALGGSGLAMAVRFLRRVAALLGPLAPVRILAADTDANEPARLLLGPHEYCNLGGFDAGAVLRNLRQYPRIAEWWPESLVAGNIYRGSKQKRPIGRLALHCHIGDLLLKLEAQIRALFTLRTRTEEERLRAAGLSVLPGEVLVYILGSSCGGTGAGIALDLAFVVRHLLSRLGAGRVVRVNGVFAQPNAYLPDLKNEFQRRRVQASAYACLREINHFQDVRHLPQVRLCLSADEPAYRPETAPFDSIALVDLENRRGECLSGKAALFDMVAAHLVLETLVQHGLQAHADNLEDVAGQRARGRLLSFGSFGVAELSFAADPVIQSCGARLAAELAHTLLQRTTPKPAGPDGRTPLIDAVERFLADHKLAAPDAEPLYTRLRSAGAP
ncbi:MAG: hypothetical protein HZA54_18645, partial [Planctomycetes bacterium]|nr:hypothetical protein [Planctomycetota bacterium]